MPDPFMLRQSDARITTRCPYRTCATEAYGTSARTVRDLMREHVLVAHRRHDLPDLDDPGEEDE